MALAKTQREDAPLFHFKAFQDVRLQREVFVEADQTGIAVNGHHADVLGLAHQHFHAAAISADASAIGVKVHLQGLFRQTLAHRRQFAGLNHRFKKRRFLERRGRCGCNGY